MLVANDRSIKTLILISFVTILGLPGIRDFTSPLIYWVLGCLPLALLLLLEVRSRGIPSLVKTVIENRPVRLFACFWMIFTAGILLSAFVNDGIGYATVPKYVALLLIFLALFSLRLTPGQLGLALMVWCAMAIVPAVLGLLFDVDAYLVFWPSRIGSVLNPPGELWKAGVFVVPVMMWGAMVSNRPRWYHWAWVVFGSLAIGFDGSRTAILAIAVFWLLFFLLALIRYPGRRLKATCVAAIMALVTSMSMGAMYPSPWNPIVMVQNLGADVQNALVESPEAELAEERQVIVTTKRDMSSDPVRIQLLKKGVESSIEHFPFGGGFGSTTVSENGGPPQVVHLVYLQLLADTGLLSLLGYLAMFGLPLLLVLGEVRRSDYPWQLMDARAVPLLVLLVYLFSGLFHPISNELSEWGIVLIALALLIAPHPGLTQRDTSFA